MTAVTCDFDFFMFPLFHKTSNFVLLLWVTHCLQSTFELMIIHTLRRAFRCSSRGPSSLQWNVLPSPFTSKKWIRERANKVARNKTDGGVIQHYLNSECVKHIFLRNFAQLKKKTPILPVQTKYLVYLTTFSRVLLEKLIVSQLEKKFPAFYGTWRFITAFTRNSPLLILILSQINPIHASPPIPLSEDPSSYTYIV